MSEDYKYPMSDWTLDLTAQTDYDMNVKSMRHRQPSYILLSVAWVAVGMIIAGIKGTWAPAIIFGLIAIAHVVFFNVVLRYWPQPVCSTCGAKMSEDWKNVKTPAGIGVSHLFHTCYHCKTYISTDHDRAEDR
jgi:hypothetical protein